MQQYAMQYYVYTYTQQCVDLIAFFDSTCLYSIHIRPTSWLRDTICLWKITNISHKIM